MIGPWIGPAHFGYIFRMDPVLFIPENNTQFGGNEGKME